MLLAVQWCDDDAPTDERKNYWNAFLAANPEVVQKRERISAAILDNHRSVAEGGQREGFSTKRTCAKPRVYL
jgi:hypothetical protein